MKVYFVSLGCDKNTVDSEVMIGSLLDAGFELTYEEEEADIAVVNTCCFINDAKEESINTIIELGELKETGKLKALIVTGCLGTRYREEIHKELPEVDAILGIPDLERLPELVDSVMEKGASDIISSSDTPIHSGKRRAITTGGYYEYLKIAEGCNKHCTYCVIPSVRGQYRSIPMEELLKEAGDLAQRGVRELILVAQETTLYGTDLYGRKALPELLHKLCLIEGLEIIRILYLYPEEINDELIETIANEPKIADYLDIPIQSGADNVLKMMGRKTSSADIYSLVDKLREAIPDIALRTTLISGFPGETREDHESTMKMVRDLKFDHLGVFTYSREENTPAASWDNQVDEAEKERRRDEIMALQKEIATLKTKALVGRKLRTIIDGAIPEEGIYVGRTYRDIPEIDGYVFIDSERELISGQIVDVTITGSDEYDLIGETEVL